MCTSETTNKVCEIRRATVRELEDIAALSDREALRKGIRENNVYVLTEEGKITAHFSLSLKTVEYPDIDIETEAFYLYRLTVAPDSWGRGTGRLLLDYTKKLCRERRQTLLLDCWSRNEKLKAFYHACGLRYMGDNGEEDYYVSVFSYNPNMNTSK